MNSWPGEILSARVHDETIGIMSATTGVLFRKADQNPTGSIMRIWAPAEVLGRPRTRRKNASSAPVCVIPSATANSALRAGTESGGALDCYFNIDNRPAACT